MQDELAGIWWHGAIAYLKSLKGNWRVLALPYYLLPSTVQVVNQNVVH